jgi:hypothetical protein
LFLLHGYRFIFFLLVADHGIKASLMTFVIIVLNPILIFGNLPFGFQGGFAIDIFLLYFTVVEGIELFLGPCDFVLDFREEE